MKRLKIALDVHGVIDRHQTVIVSLVDKWRAAGHEIHVVTGDSWGNVGKTVDALGVNYDHCFSIVDHHMAKGTYMELKPNGWWLDGDEWDRTKGGYCAREGIDIMFDDTARYAKWMPDRTTFVLVGDNFSDLAGVIADVAGALGGTGV